MLRIIVNNRAYSINFVLFESGLKEVWGRIVDSFREDGVFYAEKEDALELLLAQKNTYMPFKEFAPYKRSMLKDMHYRNIHFFRKSWHCEYYEERGIRAQVIDKVEIGRMRILCDDTKMVRMLFEWFVSTTPYAGDNGDWEFHLKQKPGPTETVVSELNSETSVTQILSLGDYLYAFLCRDGRSAGTIAELAGLNKASVYRILNAQVSPQRNVLLRLSRILNMDLSETQKLLKIGNLATLGGSNPRDIVIIDGILRNLDIVDISNNLTKNGYSDLFSKR